MKIKTYRFPCEICKASASIKFSSEKMDKYPMPEPNTKTPQKVLLPQTKHRVC